MDEKTIRKTEMALVGSLFAVDMDDAEKVFRIISPEDLINLDLSIVFNAQKIVHESGEPIDPIVVLNVLGDSNVDIKIPSNMEGQMPAYNDSTKLIQNCIASVPSFSHAISYAMHAKHNSNQYKKGQDEEWT